MEERVAGTERHGCLDCAMEWREAKPRHRVIGLCELLSCGYDGSRANRWRACGHCSSRL